MGKRSSCTRIAENRGSILSRKNGCASDANLRFVTLNIFAGTLLSGLNFTVQRHIMDHPFGVPYKLGGAVSTEPVKSPQSANNEPRKDSWWKRRRRWHKTVARLFGFAILVIILNSTLSRLYDYWDVGSGSWFSRFSGNQWNLQRG